MTDFQYGDIIQSKKSGRVGRIIGVVDSWGRNNIEWQNGEEEKVYLMDFELVRRNCKYCGNKKLYNEKEETLVCPHCDLKSMWESYEETTLDDYSDSR